MSIVHTINAYGLSIVDITTGDYYVTEVDNERKLLDEIYNGHLLEVICNDTFLVSGIDIETLRNYHNFALSPLEPWYFDDDLCIRALKEHFNVATLDGLGLKDYSIGVIAAGSIMHS